MEGYEDDPLSGKIKDGKLFGRGSADMKGGVAAAMIALAKARQLALRGDVIFAGVADEEANSVGTEQILAAGWEADAAIVSEPTDLAIIHKHKGFVWLEVDIYGIAAHGSRADLGVDAICKAGYFLVELDRHAKKLLAKAEDGKIEHVPTLHASLIKGGEEASSYPAVCTVVVEYRTVSGQTTDMVTDEIRGLLDAIAREDAQFKADVRVTFTRSPFGISEDSDWGNIVARHVHQVLGEEPIFRGAAFWTDAALLTDAGIPTLIWGPQGEGLHAKEEWVDIQSVDKVTTALTSIISEFCA